MTYIFPSVQIIKLFKNAIAISNSTSPLISVKNVTLIVLDCCAPPPVRLVAHCVRAGVVITASIISPNPITIGLAIHLISEIYDNC